MVNKKPLGKGLSAIISHSVTPSAELEKKIVETSAGSVIEIDIEKIKPNPDQPRTNFDESEIQHLAESIKSVGLIQPIIVRKEADGFFIVAGERRYRAVKSLGHKKIKSILIEADEEKNLTIALIENIQRESLDPIEEAKAYRLLINRFKLKQNDVADKVGKDRATIANSLRLLTLPEQIQNAVSTGAISQGHAKVLLSLQGGEQLTYFKEILEKGLSVRGLEKMISDSRSADDVGTVESPVKKSIPGKEAHIRDMEKKLIDLLGTRVEIKHSGNKGRIEISYYSLEDFERILEKFK